jgi:hypothetical protein
MSIQGVTLDLDSLHQTIKLSSVISEKSDAPFVTTILEENCGFTATRLKRISLHSPTSKFINISRMWLPYLTSTLKESFVSQACQLPLAVLSLLNCDDWQPSSQSNGAWCYVESNASVDRGRPQVTIWRMLIAFWITKATNTNP